MSKNSSEANLIYVSQGNIPSRWAHTFNTMHMAAWFHRREPSSLLLAQRSWRDLFRPAFDVEDWYGLAEPMPMKRLLRPGCPPGPVFSFTRDPAFDRLALNWIRRHTPRLLYTRSEPFAFDYMQSDLDRPIVVETHLDPEHKAFRRLRKVAGDARLLGVVTSHPGLRKRYVKKGFREDQVLAAPNGVDLERFDPSADRAEARRRLGWDPDRPVILYSGHLYPHKGADKLPAIARGLPDVDLVCVGGRPEEVDALRADAAGIANLRLLGFQPQAAIPDFIAAADICLLPNQADHPEAAHTCPLKLFEYLAGGRPVIATGIPALTFILRDHENARLVADRPEAFVEACRQLLDTPTLAEALAENGLETVRDCSWQARADRIFDRWMAPVLGAAPNPGLTS